MSLFDPAIARVLPFGQQGDQKRGFGRCHLAKSLCHPRNEDLSNSSRFRATAGKVLSRPIFVFVGLCCFLMSKPGWGNIPGRKIPGFESSCTTNSSSSQAKESFNKSVVCFHYLGICLEHTTRDHFPVARSGHVGNRTAFIVTPAPIEKTLCVTGKEAQGDFSTSQIPAHIFSSTSCISGTFAEETRVIKERLVIKLTALLVGQGKLPQDLQSPCYTT